MGCVIKFNEDAVSRAIDVIRKGGILIIPTDTVYGIAGDAYSYDVFTKISDLKARPEGKAFPLQIGKKEDAIYLLRGINITAMLLMRRLWPGALTIVFEGGDDIPFFLKSGGRIGIRVPDHAVLNLLLSRIGRPLIVTSANTSGRRSPNSLKEVEADIKNRADLVLDGGHIPLEKESTVVDVTREVPAILRDGAVDREKLLNALSLRKITFVCTGNSCRSVMARYYLKKISGDEGINNIDIDSAGISAVEGFGASSLTLEVLKGEGIDATSHRTKSITENLVAESCLIVVMAGIHRHFLEEKFPESRGKIRLLSGFFKAKTLSDEIWDPIGQNKDVYEKCFSVIKTGVEGMVREIVQMRKAFR